MEIETQWSAGDYEEDENKRIRLQKKSAKPTNGKKRRDTAVGFIAPNLHEGRRSTASSIERSIRYQGFRVAT
jgi:hypothetical protein